MLSHFTFETDIVARKQQGKLLFLYSIPGGVWAHLGDQKSGYLLRRGLLAGIGSVLTNPSLTCDLSGGRTSLRRLSQRTEPLKPLKNLKNLTGWVIG